MVLHTETFAAAEHCNNQIDDDGDSMVDCEDALDCYNAVNCEEDCDNGIDDDHDGATDCYDLICADDPACKTHCFNPIDTCA